MVSFTFYHDARVKNEKKKNFSAGISGNLALVRRLYGAGWTMRLYYDLDPGPAGQLQLRQLCELACADPQLDLCRVRSLPGRPLEDASEVYPLLWRFLPTLDPQVSVFLSRDLDSRITAREVAAVSEKLAAELRGARGCPERIVIVEPEARLLQRLLETHSRAAGGTEVGGVGI